MSTINLCMFASVGGGTGKTTLLWEVAGCLAIQQRTVLILDTDFGGSIHHNDMQGEGECLNDALNFQGATCIENDYDVRRAARIIGHCGYPGVRVIPAATDAAARHNMMLWAFKPSEGRTYTSHRAGGHEFPWGKRFGSILEVCAFQLPDVTDILIDCGPGMFGFPAMIATVLANQHGQETSKGGKTWRSTAFVVSTSGRIIDDAATARETIQKQIPAARIVYNRTSSHVSKVERRLFSDMARTSLLFATERTPLRGIDVSELVGLLPGG